MPDSALSIFSVAGPVMVGPSSSHTAGACKIGQFASALFNKTPEKVTFYLHGSFAEVYKGHATDKALLAGVLRMITSDPNIMHSFKIAKEKGIKFKFKKQNLGKKYHPNTVKIVLETKKKKMSVIGSSIGGGMIEILKIDKFDVLIHGQAGRYLSLVIRHDKKFDIIANIIPQLKKLGIRVAQIESTIVKDKTLSVLSLDKPITLKEVLKLEKAKGIDFIRALSKLQKQ